jgi:integrase
LLQLPDALLLGRQRFAYTWPARLFGIVLLQPAAYGGRANAHALAYMLNTEPLFFNHFDDLKLEAGIEIAALPCHANLLGWWIVHLSRCPGKLDHSSPDERALFVLALETAMRMRECYTLTIDQLSVPKKTIHLESTKNGDNRQVPLSSTALTTLTTYVALMSKQIQARDGRLFPFWPGDLSVYALDATTAELSATFRVVFAKAHVKGFRFHDLRHEATCRLYEKTTLSDILISRITGHRNLQMLKRYASLRGSDLALRLW